MVNIFTQFCDLRILSLNFRVEVLCLILGGLHDTDDLLELAVLLVEHVLLQPEDLFVVEITRLVKLAVLSTIITSFLLRGSHSSLVVLNGAILLRERTVDHLFHLLDQLNTL